jgi:hypothetical protein
MHQPSKSLTKEFPLRRNSMCVYVGSLLITFGCASRSANTHPQSSAQPKEATVKDAITNSWKPELKAGAQSYVIYDSAFITIGTDTTRTVPIKTTTFLSLIISDHGDSLRLDGMIDSLLHFSNQQITKDTAISRGHGFTLSSTGHLMPVSTSINIDCTRRSDPSEIRLPELTMSYPTQVIKVGAKWADTISTTSCHGKTTLIQQSIREFELLELSTWKDRNSAKIYRTVTSVISNDPSARNSHLTAAGNGSATNISYVDVATGALLHSSGESQSKLIVTTTRGVFPFLQTIHTEIERAN